MIKNISGTILIAMFLVSGIVGSELSCGKRSQKEFGEKQPESHVLFPGVVGRGGEKVPGKDSGQQGKVTESGQSEEDPTQKKKPLAAAKQTFGGGEMMDPQASAAYSSAKLLLEILGPDEK